METSDSPRTGPASTDTAEPRNPGQDAPPQGAEPQGTGQQGTGQRTPTSLDPRLWPRPYVDQPAGDPWSGPMRMPRFTPRPARPALPAAASATAAPPAGRAPMPPPRPASRGGRRQPVRAIIGDEIRIPFIWCEFGTCDATYTHPDALGELDLRARALAAGWRYDALGRRGCPSCAQHDPAFWTARPPAPGAGHWRRAG